MDPTDPHGNRRLCFGGRTISCDWLACARDDQSPRHGPGSPPTRRSAPLAPSSAYDASPQRRSSLPLRLLCQLVKVGPRIDPTAPPALGEFFHQSLLAARTHSGVAPNFGARRAYRNPRHPVKGLFIGLGALAANNGSTHSLPQPNHSTTRHMLCQVALVGPLPDPPRRKAIGTREGAFIIAFEIVICQARLRLAHGVGAHSLRGPLACDRSAERYRTPLHAPRSVGSQKLPLITSRQSSVTLSS
jgi:hypothetical protein